MIHHVLEVVHAIVIRESTQNVARDTVVQDPGNKLDPTPEAQATIVVSVTMELEKIRTSLES